MNLPYTQPFYLILDQGGHSSRALLFDATGTMLSLGRCPVHTRHPAPGQVEQDPQELVRSLREATAEVIAGLSATVCQQIEAAALVTQRSSMLCWRADSLEALTPVLSWQDTRAAQWLASLNLDPAWIRQKTGLVPSPHYGASKMHWCLNEIPAVAEAGETGNLVCGPLAAYLAQALTGSKTPSVDTGNGSRTLLVNINTGQWDSDLLATFGIPHDILPQVKPNFAGYGNLSVASGSIPLSLLNGDQCAAFFANGELQANSAYINVGSGAFIAHKLPMTVSAPPGLLVTPVFSVAGERQYVCEGTVNGAANALDYAAGELGFREYRQLEHWADSAAAVPLFLNGVGGLGAPFWQPDFASGFVIDGAITDYSREQKMVAVLESIVFLLAVNLEMMVRQKLPVGRLVVSGGLATLDNFCRRLATLAGLPVYRSESVEATARGAAYQLVAARGGEIRQWRVEPETVFNPEQDSWNLIARYQRWRQQMPELPTT